MSDTALVGKKVVIIEDDPLLYTLLSDKFAQLRARGVEVIPTMSAEEALEKTKTEHPDLILLDLVLPTMNGFEFLEQLRKIPGVESTRAVILSNLSSDADKERARSLGVIAYLVKANSSLSDIAQAIEEILLGHDMPDMQGKEPQVEKGNWGYKVYL